MANKVIYHVFPSRMTHLSPQLISAYSKSFKEFKQRFIVYGDESEYEIYKSMSHKVVDIVCISTTKELGKLVSKDDHIILHSLIPDICKYIFFHSYNRSYCYERYSVLYQIQ